jgi:hypothetical protein
LSCFWLLLFFLTCFDCLLLLFVSLLLKSSPVENGSGRFLVA